MLCDHLALRLSGVADGSVTLSVFERRHVERCLRCQAELARYRKLLRALRALRTDLHEPSPGLLPELLMGVRDVAERHAVRQLLSGRKVAYVSGIAAATAAGAAGAIVLAARRGRLGLVS